jgi:hypothetical protein
MALCDQLKARISDVHITKIHLSEAVVAKLVGYQTNRPIENNAETITMKITCQWPTELSHFWPLILSHFSREKSLIQF